MILHSAVAQHGRCRLFVVALSLASSENHENPGEKMLSIFIFDFFWTNFKLEVAVSCCKNKQKVNLSANKHLPFRKTHLQLANLHLLREVLTTWAVLTSRY